MDLWSDLGSQIKPQDVRIEERLELPPENKGRPRNRRDFQLRTAWMNWWVE